MLGKAEPINSCENGWGRMEEETGEVKADAGAAAWDLFPCRQNTTWCFTRVLLAKERLQFIGSGGV